MERLQQLIAPSSPRARWNESEMKNERGMSQENGSITILKMVRKRVREGLYLYLKGKVTPPMPSVKTQAQERIPRRGVHHLGF
jgi:hypothetical protein